MSILHILHVQNGSNILSNKKSFLMHNKFLQNFKNYSQTIIIQKNTKDY